MSLRFRLALAAIGIVLATACVHVAVVAWSMQSVSLFAASDMTRAGVSIAITTLLCGVPAWAAAAWIARSILRQLNEAAGLAEAVAAGRPVPSVVLGRGAETGRVLGAIVALQHALGNARETVRTSTARLAAIEVDTAAALRHEEAAVRAFGDTATEITAAVAEISATSEQLLKATGDVMAIARAAAVVADKGRDGLEQMTASMHHLDEAMNVFSRKLSTISQRAAGITAVVTTIGKVAEQTNLLSVNATIEAEKAGESGRGFRIVAQEIRRLADQTAQSTKDIERLVKEMQAAVTGGTMEMDRFRNEVSMRMGEVAAVSEQLGRVIDPVHAVTGSLELVHDGMTAQSDGARQIRAAMESLRGDAAESAASLDAFAAALQAIHAAIDDLDAAIPVAGEG